MAKIQIERSLYDDLIVFFGLTEDDDDLTEDEANELYNKIRDALQIKQQAQEARSAYRQYRIATSARDREAGRQAYLDARGMPSGVRWSKEYEQNKYTDYRASSDSSDS